ncbi:hypothetical protein [Streptomyces sp. NPDC057686]|uniref:hypothetical protein n=1 Tax=Streptomyces sp. NPDC057686 TaxID=3346212 RepID=UPI00369BB8F3
MEDEETSVAIKLARVEIKIDQIIEVQRIRGEDHESRIRALERWRYALPTTALILAVASSAITVISYVGK